MRGVIKIEAKWDNLDQAMRLWRNILNDGLPGLGEVFRPLGNYWVAEITGHDPRYGYARQFVRGRKDYRKANSVGSRGVFMFYILDRGHVYEVKNFGDRFFCTVNNLGDVIRIAKDDVELWLKSITSESMS